MSKVEVKKDSQLFCPGHTAGETCGAWIATAKVDVVGDKTVIGDTAFFFTDNLWGEDDMGLFCPHCGTRLDSHFTDAKNWRRPDGV